ncbi:MAG: hypothetical protein R3300_00085 [Candidatus Promineifilaceae bacterium]|nr:hypothetical protein [Candidatus Promineifilaceae bacterium]
MYKRLWVLSIILVLMIVLAACDGSAAERATPSEIGSVAELTDALREAGATVEMAELIDQPFFSVPGQVIQINGSAVQVFEYADGAAREAESTLISADGSSIGTSIVSWIDTPHFWARDQVIALYIGQNEAIIDLLTEILGAPLTNNG